RELSATNIGNSVTSVFITLPLQLDSTNAERNGLKIRSAFGPLGRCFPEARGRTRSTGQSCVALNRCSEGRTDRRSRRRDRHLWSAHVLANATASRLLAIHGSWGYTTLPKVFNVDQVVVPVAVHHRCMLMLTPCQQ